MTHKLTPQTRLTLGRAFTIYILALALALALIAGLLMRDRAARVQTDVLNEAVFVRAQGVSAAFGMGLSQIWTSLDDMARRLQPESLDKVTAQLEVIASRGGISWAGFADLSGQVKAASGGLLIGQDVSSRPWFQQGLMDKFTGDVHDAVLLNRLLGGSEEEPLRFVDMALPVREASGDVIGVLGVHIDAGWLAQNLTDLATPLQMDAFLVNGEGKISIGTDAIAVDQLGLPSLRAAASGVQESGQEVWPDGARYFSAVVPEVAANGMPPFGWRLVARIDPETFQVQYATLTRGLFQIIGLGLAVLLLTSLLFWRVFLAPLRRLAENGAEIASGTLVPPREERATREYAILSTAIAKLQRVQLGQDRIRPS